MTVRTITRTGIGISIKLVRLPYDLAVGLLPGQGTRAKLLLDRAEAGARSLAGTALLDRELREDARRRRAAAAERERAAALRQEAEQVSQQADGKVDERHRQAQKRRRQADRRAAARRERASEQRDRRRRSAAKEGDRRKQAVREAHDQIEEQIEEEAPAARLDALDEQAAAQAERDRALTEAEEAERLEHAAARAKEERQSS